MTRADFEKIITEEGNYEVFDSSNFLCEMKRNGAGAWCGYVHLPPDHPWYGMGYDNIQVEVHGGLTFAEEIDKMWCIGFDACHAGDLSLANFLYLVPDSNYGEIYRDKNYIKHEVESLAFSAALVHKPQTEIHDGNKAKKYLTNG